MSIINVLKYDLGIVEGILIPGASASTTTLTHTVQSELAKLYSAAAADLAKKLAVDTTGITGPDKVFAITKAIVGSSPPRRGMASRAT